MAGEITSAGAKLYYAPESTAGTCPSTGFKEKATGATLNLAEYLTGLSGFAADFDTHDVTTISETVRHQFIGGLQSNDGKITLNCNINPTSRDDWQKIVAEYTALTGGKGLWWEFVLPGDTDGFFFRGEPKPMLLPDIEAASNVSGNVQIIENKCTGWATKITS